ncbi:MAG: CRISPR-associated endonuclease Cas2 [Pseudomonadota bacterium]
MSKETRRFMRLLVLFDLPTKTKIDRKAAGQFRRFLLQDGYMMLQLSVYSRVINGHDALQKHIQRLQRNLPQRGGSVQYLCISEKQFSQRGLLLGEKPYQEKKVGTQQLCLF